MHKRHTFLHVTLYLSLSTNLPKKQPKKQNHSANFPPHLIGGVVEDDLDGPAGD